jgi:hypothetical protein
VSKYIPRPPLSLDSDGDILDAEGHLLAVIGVDGKSLTNVFLAALDLLEFAQQVAQVAKNHGNLFIHAWAESVCKNAGFPVVLKDEPDFVAGGGK